MKIALTCHKFKSTNDVSILNNGHYLNVLLWYHFFENCGYDVIYISNQDSTGKITNDGRDYNIVSANDYLENESNLLDAKIDYLFIVGNEDKTLNRVAQKHSIPIICLMMGNTYATDLDNIIYGTHNAGPDGLKNQYSQIWVSPHFAYSIEYYKIRYGIEDISIGPYIWGDDVIKQKKTLTYTKGNKLIVAICEPNLSDKKNCMIPLCICEKGEKYIDFVRCYCTDKLRKCEGFVNFCTTLNIHKNKKAVFNDRDPIYEVLGKCNCVISTTQEWDLNYLFLECFYFGIPLIHNSKMLQEYGYYYPDLDIIKGAEQIEIVFKTHDTKLYIERHKQLLYKYSINNTYYHEWVKQKLANPSHVIQPCVYNVNILPTATITSGEYISRPLRLNDCEIPVVISYCNKYKTENFENTCRFVNTLELNNWEYKIIGHGEIWNGFITKMTGYRDYLKTLDSNKIVVISDAHDVYCTRNSTNFIKEFNKYNANIIVSMEMFAEGSLAYSKEREPYFQVTWLGEYFKYHNIDPNSTFKKYVNSGLLIGYAKHLLHLFNWCLENNYTDDQKALGAYMNKYPEGVYADINNNILHTTSSFVNIGLQHKNQMDDAPSFDELMGRRSFFLHIPGIGISNGQKYLYTNIYNFIKAFNSKEAKKIYPNYDIENFENYHNDSSAQSAVQLNNL